jgi:tetratricopeptide (TPR) repeat protein
MLKSRAILIALALLLLVAAPDSLSAQGKGKGKKKDKTKASKEQPTGGGEHTAARAKLDYLFIEANTQYLQGNKAEAIGLYKEVLGLDPKHDASLYNIGKLYAELGDHENARRYCEQAVQLKPGNYWYNVELIAAYQKTHAYDKALSTQENLVKRFPEEKNALYDLAQMYISKKRYQEALNVYSDLERLTGMNEEIAFRKHQLYVFLNQPEKAVLELDRLIQANPSEVRYHQAKYDLYNMMGKEAEAFLVLEDLLKANPNDSFALLALADYYKAKGDMAKSDDYLFRAFRNPAVDLDAKLKILSGLYALAERDASMVERVHQLSDILYAAHPASALSNGIRGDVFQLMQQPDSARAAYRKSIAIEPTNEQVWQELLVIDAERNDFKAMAKDAEKALEYFPNQSSFLYFYGLGSERTKQNEEAIYAFEKLKKISSISKDLRLQALLSLGSLYNDEEDYTKSDENFEAALALDATNPLVLNNYAYFLSLRNTRLADAERMVLKALDLEPNSSAYQDTYGWILFLKNDLEGAKTWVGKAVAAGGGADVLEHYGDIWNRLGDAEKAKTYWQKALDEGADNFTMQDKLKAVRQP